jgi:glycine/D-amino acid oxidase-like deaminating enzyme
MLQWELDRTLGELETLYGFERAAGIYRRSAASVAGLAKLIGANGIVCGFRPRNTLYLANNHEGARELMDEQQLRRRAGLPGHYLEHPDLFTQYELDRDAAILSPGSAEADPLLLTWALLQIAMSRGARLINASVTALHSEGGHVSAATDGPYVIEARHVVLATGYSMPGLDMPKLHRTSSSWALATVPQKPEDLWRDGMLLWEDSHPYLYLRTTDDNRIIAGGEDDDTTDPEERDRKLPGKIMAIREKLKRLWPKADTRVEHAWCGTFGETADSLPLIGPVPGMNGVYTAYGYGGNGITFSYLAARMIGAMLAGMQRDWFEDFALDRDAPGFKTEPVVPKQFESVIR